SPAELVVGVTERRRALVVVAVARELGRARGVGVLVVSGVQVVQGARHLEQTPGLIDADVADDVRNISAAVGIAKRGDVGAWRTVQAKVAAGDFGSRRVDDLRAVVAVGAGVIDTDGARHAIAELHGVLDVVDAGDGVIAADQTAGQVTRKALPRRGKARSRL